MAGNNRTNLDVTYTSYPVCYDSRVRGVGSLNKAGGMSYFSNYGTILKYWKLGEEVSAGGFTMSGTSQATPQATADIARQLSKYYNKKARSYSDYICPRF